MYFRCQIFECQMFETQLPKMSLLAALARILMVGIAINRLKGPAFAYLVRYENIFDHFLSTTVVLFRVGF